MSDRTVPGGFSSFFDFERWAADLNVDSPATDCISALHRYILLQPTPASVWAYLPLALHGAEDSSLQGLRYVVFPHSSITPPIKNESFFTLSNINGSGRSDTVFLNWEADDGYSCATRLLHMLGWRNLPSERFQDINKVGLWKHRLLAYLKTSYTPQIAVDSTTFMAYKLEDLSSGLLSAQLIRSYLVETSRCSPHVSVRIILLADHVIFSVRHTPHTLHLLPNSRGFSDSYPGNAFCREVLPQWSEAFPPTTGRAGAKMFVQYDHLKTVPPTTPATFAYSRLLTSVARRALGGEDCDLEATFIKISWLLQFVDIVGSDIISWLTFNQDLWVELNVAKIAKKLKNAHAQMRICNTLPNRMLFYGSTHSRRQCARLHYGLDTIMGRTERLQLDFPAEQVMRMHDPVRRTVPILETLPNGFSSLRFSQAQYLCDMRTACRQMAESLLKDKVHTETFEHYFKRRFFWAASGGAPGAKVRWIDSSENLRVSKRGAMLAIKLKSLRSLLDRTVDALSNPAVSWSVKALKFESGKLRAILNTITEHYIIQGYISEHVDSYARSDGWYSAGHSLAARIANQLRRLRDLSVYSALMFDFSDFNINHTFLLMAEETLARVDVLIERSQDMDRSPAQRQEVLSDLRQAAVFVVTARYNTFVVDNDSGIVVRTRRSLQSGERDTSRVNSDSNHIADQVVRRAAVRLFGIDPSPKVTDKTGDDVFKLAYSITYAVLLVGLYNLTGQAGQPFKIQIEYNTFEPANGEYLRLDYDASARSVAGYPIRALCGFVHGEFFQDPIPQPLERAAAFLRQLSKLRRRGCTIPRPLAQFVISSNCRLVFTDPGGKRVFTPNLTLVQMPLVLGGVGLQWDAKGPLTGSTPLVEILGSSSTLRALIIPSGEGKSTLARQYPTLFVDHDSLVSQSALTPLRQRALITGNWSAVNAYLREVACDFYGISALYGTRTIEERLSRAFSDRKNLVLLTWAPDTITADFSFEAMLLKDLTGIRANVANRRSLNATGIEYHVYSSHSARNAAALAYAVPFEYGGLVRYMRNTGGTTQQGKSTLPVYRPPRLDTKSATSRMDVIGDYTAAAALGVPKPLMTEVDIVQSSLTGAWPKKDLNASLAAYARDLSAWQDKKHFSVETRHVPLFVEMSALKVVVHRKVRKSLGIIHTPANGIPVFRLNEQGFPSVVDFKHLYDSVGSLTKPLGCSVDSTSRAILNHFRKQSDGTMYSGLRALAAQLKSRKSPSAAVHESAALAATERILTVYDFFSDPGSAGISNANSPAFDFPDKWISGSLSFIPPHEEGLSSDLVTFIRDLTLHILEQDGICTRLRAQLVGTNDPTTHSLTVYVLERAVTTFVMSALHEIYPGVHLSD